MSKTIKEVLEDLRYDIEDECDTKHTGPVIEPKIINDEINTLADQALLKIQEIIKECIGEDDLLRRDKFDMNEYKIRDELRNEIITNLEKRLK